MGDKSNNAPAKTEGTRKNTKPKAQSTQFKTSSQQMTTQESGALSIKKAEERLMHDFEFLSYGDNYSLFNAKLFLPLERTLSTQRDFYSKNDIRMKFYKQFVTQLCVQQTKNDKYAKTIVQRYVQSPFGIFDFTKDIKVSDLFMVKNRITFTNTNNEKAYDIRIPQQYLPIYYALLTKFIRLTTYASNVSNTKFDKGSAVLDYECDKVRFNVAHESLNATFDGGHIVSLRNQLLDFNQNDLEKARIFNEGYIEGQNLNKEQLNFINELASKGSYCIYGETGSGKTTLLKYMAGYDIANKRNLISIEDTKELFLPINIAYLTNEHYTINDLFRISLRENPSHLIVGETRSSEIRNILESALVFKCGTTLHADSFEKTIMRIVFLIKGEDNSFETKDINSLITATMDGFVHMRNRQIVSIWRRKGNITDLSDILNNYECIKSGKQTK